MIRRSTLVLVFIFVVFAAFAVYWQRSANGEETAVPSATPQVQLFNFEADSVNSIHLESAAGMQTQYDEQSDGSWALIGETLQTARPEEVVQVINQVSGLRALNTLVSPPEDSALGLNPPAYRIEFFMEGGQSIALEVGVATATGSGYYARTAGKTYVVSKSIIDQAVELISSPPILTPVPTITTLPVATATP